MFLSFGHGNSFPSAVKHDTSADSGYRNKPLWSNYSHRFFLVIFGSGVARDSGIFCIQ